VSLVAAVALPSAVVKLTFPVTARSGTVNVTSVGDEATTTVTTAPTFTTGSALPVFRFVPLTTTGLSSDAIGGVKPVRSNVTRIGPASPWRHAAGPSPPDARMSTMRRSNASRGVSADPYARAGKDER
jgi:hypothetical protein